MDSIKYTGAYSYKIDYKGRVAIPGAFRQKGIPDKFIITRGDDGCLLLLTEDQWRLRLAGIRSDRDLRLFMAWSEDQHVVGGHILLRPRYLKMMATEGTHVIFVGVGDHIEIWAPEDYAIDEPMHVE